MRLLRPSVRGLRAERGSPRPIDELERSLERLRLDGDASRQLLDGVLASEDVIGAFADAEALARALASLPCRRPAVVARPMPRLAFATVALASTMTVGTAFAQDLPAIAKLAVAHVVALVERPAPGEAAVKAPVLDSSWRETPASNPRALEPESPPTPASIEIEPEPQPPAPSPAVEPAPAAEPVEAHVQPPPAQPDRGAEDQSRGDEPVVPVHDRARPPLLPDGVVVEELEPVVGAPPVVESSTALPDASAEPEPPSLPEEAADAPVVSDDPDEPVDDDEGKGKDKKEKDDHADEHAHEHADEHAAVHDWGEEDLAG